MIILIIIISIIFLGLFVFQRLMWAMRTMEWVPSTCSKNVDEETREDIENDKRHWRIAVIKRAFWGL